MFLIIGLGNPGQEYAKTRHNVGFMILDKLRSDLKLDDWADSEKFHAKVADGKIGPKKILLLKPQTFMNNSGQAVAAAAKFYKIKSADIWVVHDDLDWPLGKKKIQRNRSAAGHQGAQSIIDALGTQDFVRFRVGIAPAKPTKKNSADFVLSRFNREEVPIVQKTISTAIEAIQFAIKESVEKAMTKYN